MQQAHVVLLMTIAMMVANVYGQGLKVTIVSTGSKINQAPDGVDVLYSNAGDQTMSIFNWYLEGKEINEPLFKVTCLGVPVPYIGRL
ncbi:unnamed protein product, partial [Rotaria sordida]